MMDDERYRKVIKLLLAVIEKADSEEGCPDDLHREVISLAYDVLARDEPIIDQRTR